MPNKIPHLVASVLALCCGGHAAHMDFVLAAFEQNISSIAFPPLIHYIPLMPSLVVANVTLFDMDVQRNCLFYTTVGANKIFRKCGDLGGDTGIDVIADGGLQSLTGLSYDWKSEALYFVNAESRCIELIPIGAHHSHRTNVLRRMLVRLAPKSVPCALAVDPLGGFVFWSDANVAAKSIWRANLDGTNARALLEATTAATPTRLAIDSSAGHIYWTDLYDRSIGRCDFDGGHAEQLVNEDFGSAPVFAVGPEHLYWFNDDTMELFVGHKANGTTTEKVRSDAKIGAMKVVANATQTGDNACDTGHLCTYICVGAPNGSYGCLCPDETFFECADKLCLRDVLKCDGQDDCGDNSDEEHCGIRLRCTFQEFRCPFDGRCIPRKLQCDGRYDCFDGSDEDACWLFGLAIGWGTWTFICITGIALVCGLCCCATHKSH